MHKVLVLAAVWLAISSAGAEDTALFQAIRNGNALQLRTHLTKESVNLRDGRGTTLLMYAAAFGNLPTLKLLLDKGADVNARNDLDATALLWAARDPEKARLLIERGAGVSVQSKQGRTPLMIASMLPGGSSIVALMLEKGSDVQRKDSRGETALALAAKNGDVAIMRLLLAKGADPNAVDATGRTPIIAAAGSHRAEAVQLLISSGVDVNAASTPPPATAPRTVNVVKNGPPNNTKITALHLASGFGPVQSVRYLLEAGAHVDARDSRNLTPLSFALATEYPSLDIVHALLRAGANVNASDSTGETPLDWAEKFGFPKIVAALKEAGARSGLKQHATERARIMGVEAAAAAPMAALTRSIKLLEATSTTFFKGSGCVGCHHQPLLARAQFFAKYAGVPVDEAAAKEHLLQMRVELLRSQEEFLQTINPGGGANRLAESLLGLKAAGYPADGLTDAAIVNIASFQELDGGWGAGDVQNRPPIAQSRFASTTRIMRALQDYGMPARKQEFAERIARARAWLTKTKPVSTEDFSMRLAGLALSGAPKRDTMEAAKALLALQQSDGSWGANPYKKGDAYATSNALVALSESHALEVNDPAYHRGVSYLLSTQFPDGSWHVQSRSIKFQPYFESGFPFGHDQWISTAATAWATQAISLTLRPPAKKVKPT